jgi:hypothetical protein
VNENGDAGSRAAARVRNSHDFGANAVPKPNLFSSDGGDTPVELDAQVELHGAAALLPHLARRAVKNGGDENLATLKRVLEEAAS